MKNLLLTVTLLASNVVMANSFTLDIQKAGYGFDQYDEKGVVTHDKFLSEFRGFPWKDQVGKNSGGSEPTISVKNSESKIDMWVSVLGSSDEYAYLVGLAYPKKIKTLFGLGKEKEVRWVVAYVVEDSKEVESLFEMFFKGDTAGVKSKLAEYPEFLNQEGR